MVMHSGQFFRRTQGINTQAHLQSRWLKRLFSALAKARSALQSELRARRDAAELESMDDRMLRDIGISRGEINSVVRRPVASARRAHLGWERQAPTAVIVPVPLDRGDGPSDAASTGVT
jgi:uncharacterized protein YjiS (DUF1127 family)